MAQSDFDQKFREKLLETFKFTIDFLESHNLRWWAAYGTCLGAVRHHGMIPWDDDIDILMPREDFDKLRSLQSELINTKYSIASLDTEKYPNPYLEIYDTTTTIVEIKKRPFILGTWVDIFPLDRTDEGTETINNNIKKFSSLCAKYKAALSQYYYKDMMSLLCHGHLKAFTSDVLGLISRPKDIKSINKQMRLFIKSLDHKDGNTLVSYSAGFYGAKCIYDASWFENYILLDFEDFKVKIPQGYDQYLTYAYGDYMTPPPSDKQVTHHSRFYVNLRERLDFSTICDRISKGENIVY